jgi:glycosyltransferase involved in cell wall biosynthesis
LIDVVAEAARRRPCIRLLLVGDGPLRPAIEQRLSEAGLSRRVIFAGLRGDVPSLLQAMDVFLFPSLWEGLPLTVLEAQAAGLPCVMSDVISEETDVVGGLTSRLALSDGAARWASEVLAAERRPACGRARALAEVENSSFNIRNSIQELYALYQA